MIACSLAPPTTTLTLKNGMAEKTEKTPQQANHNPDSTNLKDTGFDPVVHECSEDLQKESCWNGKGQEWGDKIPIGVFYQNELEPTFQDRLTERIPFYMQNPPAKQQLKDENSAATVDLSEFLNDLKTS